MKKVISTLCAALLLGLTLIPVSASGVEKWTAGNGYKISGSNSPVTITEAKDGIQCSWGGRYEDGTDWGGLVYNDKVTLDGFTAEIRVDKLPVTDKNSDAWLSFSFMSEPRLFWVSGNYTKNLGISNLMRYSYATPAVVSYGPDKWAEIANDKDETAFSCKVGDVIKVAVNKKDGKYVLSINGKELTAKYDLSTISPDGTAYFVFSASMKNSEKDVYQFTITKINGKATVATTATTVTSVTTDKKPVTAPATSDVSAIIFGICAMSAAATVYVSKKRSK